MKHLSIGTNVMWDCAIAACGDRRVAHSDTVEIGKASEAYLDEITCPECLTSERYLGLRACEIKAGR